MKKIFVFVVLIFLSTHAANEQTGPQGGAGTQMIQPEVDNIQNLNVFANYIENNVILHSYPCHWSYFVGDVVAKCNVPLDIQVPQGIKVNLKGYVVLKCKDQEIALSEEFIDFNRSTNSLSVSGPSFGFNGVAIISDEKMAERQKKDVPSSFKTCAKSEFTMELIPNSGDVHMASLKKGKLFNGLMNVSKDNPQAPKSQELAEQILRAKMVDAYKYCGPTQSFDQKRCDREYKAMSEIGLHIVKKGFADMLKGIWNKMDLNEQAKCQANPKTSECVARQKKLDECDKNNEEGLCKGLYRPRGVAGMGGRG